MSRLCEPIDLSKLAGEGLEFRIDAKKIEDGDSSSEDDIEKKLQQGNRECIGIFDEEVYEEGEPFEIMSKKMDNMVFDGKIKKRIIREGDGEKPEEFATVKVHYNAYVEYEDEPFDSTYIRNKPRIFTLNDGRVIAGLDFAVQSMRQGEKSQFLIHPDYAFGKHCLLGRVPENATVLFEVELLEIVNCGATITYENLPEDLKNTFTEVYKYAIALCEKAKRLFKEHNYKKAIIDYNTAAIELEKVPLNGTDEIENQRELALKVYSNLLICYMRNSQPKKGCTTAVKIYKLTSNGELLKIPTKVYFNHAKCLRILGEYDEATTILDKARRMEPNNPEIINEMLNLEKERSEYTEKQTVFAKGFMGK